MAVGRLQDEDKVDDGEDDEGLLEDLDALGPRRSSPLESRPPPVRLLKVELLLGVEVVEVGGPPLASPVRVVGDVERGGLVVAGPGAPAEERLEPRPRRQFRRGLGGGEAPGTRVRVGRARSGERRCGRGRRGRRRRRERGLDFEWFGVRGSVGEIRRCELRRLTTRTPSRGTVSLTTICLW